MKKRKTILIIIVCFLIVVLIFNSLSTKTYVFNTFVPIESKGETRHISMTKEFSAKLDKMNLEDKIISSHEYGVTMQLNFIQLKWLLMNRELKNYYVSYDEARNLSKGGFSNSELKD